MQWPWILSTVYNNIEFYCIAEVNDAQIMSVINLLNQGKRITVGLSPHMFANLKNVQKRICLKFQKLNSSLKKYSELQSDCTGLDHPWILISESVFIAVFELSTNAFWSSFTPLIHPTHKSYDIVVKLFFRIMCISIQDMHQWNIFRMRIDQLSNFFRNCSNYIRILSNQRKLSFIQYFEFWKSDSPSDFFSWVSYVTKIYEELILYTFIWNNKFKKYMFLVRF